MRKGILERVNSEIDDLVELYDYATGRLRDRLAGLTDAEWRWSPTGDDRIGLRWRLRHISDLLGEERNWSWLGVASPVRDDVAGQPTSAEEALATLDSAVAAMRTALLDPGLALAVPIGAPAGRYGAATRRSFALHVFDELIHHAAEAALLRDLYADRQPR